MIFPTNYSDCFVMDNDDINDILKQLETGNTFRSYITTPSHGAKEVCAFKARVFNPSPNTEAIEYYWMTNDERRNLIRKIKVIQESASSTNFTSSTSSTTSMNSKSFRNIRNVKK